MAKNDLTISDLSGGVNDTDPAFAVPDDQCLIAENVEFVYSTLGEKRNGTVAIDIEDSNFDVIQRKIVWLYRHLPSTDETEAQLWGFGVNAAVSSVLSYKDTAWHNVALNDAITVSVPYAYQLRGRSFQGKLFFAYKSAEDRLHVWDGTELRRTGLAQPEPPLVGDSGVGTYAGLRYFRARFTVQDVDGATLRRSEPSTTVAVTPLGTAAGFQIFRPTLIDEGETHWEIEASLNNSDFYVISTADVATASYADSTPYATGYAAGVLSEDVGDYEVQRSARFLAVDENRLLVAGSFDDADLSSRVSWTPVFKDPGDGNDERIPLDTDNFVDLDTYEGGGLTDISDSINGIVYAFKIGHTYKLLRSGQRTRAYDDYPVSTTIGAFTNSLVEAPDQAGDTYLYFLDRQLGPCRVGPNGIQTCGRDIQTLWGTVNPDAAIAHCRVLYYPFKRQIHWWLATGTEQEPDKHLVLHTDRTRVGQDGVRRGFVTATGESARATAVVMFAENVDDGTARSLTLKPLIGQRAAGINDAPKIVQLDTGDDDDGVAFSGTVRTKPYFVAGLLNKFGIRAAALLAKAASAISVYVTPIKNFGVETGTPVTADLTPVGSETAVVRPLDDLKLSELNAVQFVYGDSASDGQWQMHQLAFKTRAEETA